MTDAHELPAEEKINVMVNGLPGNMASISAEHIEKDSNLNLLIYSLTGPEIADFTAVRSKFVLIKPGERESFAKDFSDKNYIQVDYTHPDAVNINADFYCRHNLPFVMGTTGGNRKALEERVENSEICAVIAPNMAKQIVAFQEIMSDFSNKYKGELKDCGLIIRESHQGPNAKYNFKGKRDTSGTADAVRQYFNKMGIPFEKKDITKIRLREDQLKLGVPKTYISGHGWHTYWVYDSRKDITNIPVENKTIQELSKTLNNFLQQNIVFADYHLLEETTSNHKIINRISRKDGVSFTIKNNISYPSLTITHNVNGRDVYASGTIDAIKFLDKKMKEGNKRKVYSMIDVLRG